MHCSTSPESPEGYLSEAELDAFVDSQPHDCCLKCRFWKPDEAPTWSEPFNSLRDETFNQKMYYAREQGECRRRAPQFNVVFADVPESDESVRGYFPGTSYDEWCGEFEKSPAAPLLGTLQDGHVPAT